MDPYHVYLRDVGRCQNDRDLVLRHLSLVIWWAKKYLWSGIGLEELVAAGNLGLVRASRNFKAEKGFAFTTFASAVIRDFLNEEVRRLSGPFVQNRVEWQRKRPLPVVVEADESIAAVDSDESIDCEAVHNSLATLPVRSRYVIRGWMDGKSGPQIADDLGVTRERVRQIKMKSFAELRDYFFGRLEC